MVRGSLLWQLCHFDTYPINVDYFLSSHTHIHANIQMYTATDCELFHQINNRQRLRLYVLYLSAKCSVYEQRADKFTVYEKFRIV